MLKKLLKITLVVSIIGAGIFFAKHKMLFGKNAYLDYKSQPVEDESKVSGIAAYIDFFNIRKANPTTGIVDINAVYNAFQQYESHKLNKTGSGSNLKWTEMGPDNIGGRCRAILIDKDSNNVVYAGGVTGGIFKSLDGGATWAKVTTNANIQNQNSVCICQGADGAIYYGTGEAAFGFGIYPKGAANYGPMNYGQGIFKSTDHGYTFTQLKSTQWSDTAGSKNPFNGWQDVSSIAADPTNPKRIYAGNDAGLQVSNDGGTTWTSPNGLPKNFSCKDIKMTKDGQTIFIVAGTGGYPQGNHAVYRSTDGGANFAQVGKNPVIPSGSFGMVVSIAPSNEKTVYVSVANNSNSSPGLAGVYRSDDQGNTWTSIVTGDANFVPLTQGEYANALCVDPLNSDKVYIAGLNMFSIEKNGTAYQTTQITGGSPPYYVHVDYHNILFDHAAPYPNMYVGTDGGVFKSADVSNPNTKAPHFFQC